LTFKILARSLLQQCSFIISSLKKRESDLGCNYEDADYFWKLLPPWTRWSCSRV
jgi:hypothetical protein